jgi:murein endopeptidase
MQAISCNALADLEDSVANQQVLSVRLGELANDLCVPLETGSANSQAGIDEDLKHQIGAASDALQKLNQRYAALLRHSSRSVALMASLFSSFQGQFQEASGPGSHHKTWSCQM